jgi:hypothetical protein
MELNRKVPGVAGTNDRSRRRLASVRLGCIVLVAAASSCFAAETNSGYPTEIVPLRAGLLLCLSVEQVERAFEAWKTAFEQRLPEQMVKGCARIPEGYSARIQYLRSFENEHWNADLLRFLVLKPAAPGILVFDDIYYGFGSARLRPAVLGTLKHPAYE